MAHDFNNMLTVINGYCEFLMESLGREESTYQIIEQIRKAGKRAAALTYRILTFSRRQTLQPEVLDLNAAVENTEKMLSQLIGERW